MQKISKKKKKKNEERKKESASWAPPFTLVYSFGFCLLSLLYFFSRFVSRRVRHKMLCSAALTQHQQQQQACRHSLTNMQSEKDFR